MKISDTAVFFLGLLGVILVICTLAGSWEYYRAGVQQAVYDRQGIHMSRWEIWLGAKPATAVQRTERE